MKPLCILSLAVLALLSQTVAAQPPNAETSEASTSTSGSGLLELIGELSRTSGLEFVVDPRVRADPIYVGGSADITYSKLLSVLRVYGYTAVQTGGRVHVVPTAVARQLPTRLVQEDDPSVSDDEIVTRIIELDSETPGLVPILRPLLPQYAHLASDGEQALVIVDHYDNVRRISTLAEMLNDSR